MLFYNSYFKWGKFVVVEYIYIVRHLHVVCFIVPVFGHERILKVSSIIFAGFPSTMALAR